MIKSQYLKFVIVYILIAMSFAGNAFSNEKVWLTQGKKAMQAKNYEEAIAAFSRVIEHAPNHKEAHFSRGEAYLFANQFNEALSDFSRVIEIDPYAADAYNYRGLCYGYIGSADNAITDFDKAIELDQNFAEAYLNRGSAYVSLMNNNKARKDFDRAIKLDPKNPSIYYQRGRLNYKLKKHKSAIKDFSKAIKLGFNYSSVYYNRGNAYFKSKQYKKAIKDYTKAIKLNPEDTEALNNRAMAYELTGNKKKAKADRAKLNKMAGYKFPLIETIKFAKFSAPKNCMTIEMPKNWHKTSSTDGDIIELLITQEEVKDIKDYYSVGVRLSYNKNMSKVIKVENEAELLEFWKGSVVQNANEYHRYDIYTTTTIRIGAFSGVLNKVALQVTPDSMPLRLYELGLVHGDTLIFGYFQSPEVQFGYYKKIFDKAIKSLKVK